MTKRRSIFVFWSNQSSWKVGKHKTLFNNSPKTNLQILKAHSIYCTQKAVFSIPRIKQKFREMQILRLTQQFLTISGLFDVQCIQLGSMSMPRCIIRNTMIGTMIVTIYCEIYLALHTDIDELNKILTASYLALVCATAIAINLSLVMKNNELALLLDSLEDVVNERKFANIHCIQL